MGTVRTLEKGRDSPPSYEDIIKSEPPPPAYDLVVEESPKTSPKQTFSPGFSTFSLKDLPKVFGRGSGNRSSSPLPSTSTAQESAPSSSSNYTLKKVHRGKSSVYCSSSPPPSICAALPTAEEQLYGWKSSSQRKVDPPPYSDSFVDVESQAIASCSHTSSPPARPKTRSVFRGTAEAVMNEALRPIFSPIYKNTPNSSPSDNTVSRPQTSHEPAGRRVSVSISVDVEREKNSSTPVGS